MAEYLLSGEPSTVILSSNKIFFKLAIENGLTLIPIYAFDTEKPYIFYPSLNKWRDKLKIGVQTLAIVPFSGRFFLPIPFKTTSKVAIGEPIKIEKKDRPSWEDIENCSKLYTSCLNKLYNENKSEKAPSLKIL